MCLVSSQEMLMYVNFVKFAQQFSCNCVCSQCLRNYCNLILSFPAPTFLVHFLLQLEIKLNSCIWHSLQHESERSLHVKFPICQSLDRLGCQSNRTKKKAFFFQNYYACFILLHNFLFLVQILHAIAEL